MAGRVELAVVHHRQHPIRTPQGHRGLPDQRPERVRAQHLCAAHGRDRQPGPPERGVGHAERADPRVGRALEDSGSGLPDHGIDPLIPAQRVEQPALPRHRHLIPEHAVLPRRPPGPQGRQAGGGGRRESRGQRPPDHGQLGQERHRRRVVTQQFPAQAVHDQQARAVRRRQLQRVGLRPCPQRGEHRTGEIGKSALAVTRQRRQRCRQIRHHGRRPFLCHGLLIRRGWWPRRAPGRTRAPAAPRLPRPQPR